MSELAESVEPTLETDGVDNEKKAGASGSPLPGKLERMAPIIAGVLLAVPSLAAHYLPMSDLPLHEGAVGLLRHFGDEAYAPRDLYRLNLGHPNQLFYLAGWALSYAVGTTWAVKIVIATTQVLIFWAGARLADHLGRSRWSVMLLAPLSLGFTYFWGLTTNLVGFAALLGVLPAIDRAAVEPRARRCAATCGLLVLTYFAHESVFMAATAFVGLLAVAYPLDRRKTSLRFAPVVFATALAYAQQLYQAHLFSRAIIITPPKFPTPWMKIVGLPTVLFGSHDRFVQLTLMAISAITLLLFFAARIRSREAPPTGIERAASGRFTRLQAFLLRYRFELTGFGFLALYFAMPFNWNGATILYERFLGPAWALLAICAVPRLATIDVPRISKLLGALVPIAILLVSWPQFVDSDATSRDLDMIFAAIPKGSAVALANLDRPIYRTRVYSASVEPARALAVRGGRLGLSLSMSPIAPVQLRPEYRWDEFDTRTVASGSRALQPTRDLTRFGWVIAQSRDLGVRALIVEAFKPDARCVMAQGEWLLFQSTHPQIPLTSPDAPPDPHAETLVDRMERISRALRERLKSASPPSPSPDVAPTVDPN